MTATGTTTARVLSDRLAEVINVRDFGAIGDGVTDDTGAFQAALSAVPNGGVVWVPTGQFCVYSTLTVSGKSLVLLGDSDRTSLILTTHTNRTLDIELSSSAQWVQIRNIGFVANAPAQSAECIKIAGSAATTAVDGAAMLQNVRITGNVLTDGSSPYGYSYIGAGTLLNLWLSTLRDVVYTGPNTYPPVAGTYGWCFAKCFDLMFDNCKVFATDIAFYQTDYCEYMSFQDADVVGANAGFATATRGVSAQGGFYGLSLYVNGGEWDTYNCGLSPVKIAGGYIHDNHIDIRNSSIGLNAVLLTDCQRFTVHNNLIECFGTGGQGVGIHIAQSAGQANANLVHNNMFTNLSTAVQFGAFTYYNIAHDNQMLNGASISEAYVNNGTFCEMTWTDGAGNECHPGNRIFAGAAGQSLVVIVDAAGATQVLVLQAGTANATVQAQSGSGQANLNLLAQGTAGVVTIVGEGGITLTGPVSAAALTTTSLTVTDELVLDKVTAENAIASLTSVAATGSASSAQLTGASAGNVPTLAAIGSTGVTNVNLGLLAAGTGIIQALSPLTVIAPARGDSSSRAVPSSWVQGTITELVLAFEAAGVITSTQATAILGSTGV